MKLKFHDTLESKGLVLYCILPVPDWKHSRNICLFNEHPEVSNNLKLSSFKGYVVGQLVVAISIPDVVIGIFH